MLISGSWSCSHVPYLASKLCIGQPNFSQLTNYFSSLVCGVATIFIPLQPHREMPWGEMLWSRVGRVRRVRTNLFGSAGNQPINFFVVEVCLHTVLRKSYLLTCGEAIRSMNYNFQLEEEEEHFVLQQHKALSPRLCLAEDMTCDASPNIFGPYIVSRSIAQYHSRSFRVD